MSGFAATLHQLREQLADADRSLRTDWDATEHWIRGTVRRTLQQSAIDPLVETDRAAANQLDSLVAAVARAERILWE